MGHFYFTRHGQTIWNVENPELQAETGNKKIS